MLGALCPDVSGPKSAGRWAVAEVGEMPARLRR
ncbi:hypothetical protein SSPIM334S_07242 [Streptomyces spiroverticillatus]